MTVLTATTTGTTVDKTQPMPQREIFSCFMEKFPNTITKDFAVFVLGWLELFGIKDVTTIQMTRALTQIGFPRHKFKSLSSALIFATRGKNPLIHFPDGYTRFQKDNQYSLTITGRKKFRKDYREFALTMKTQTGQDD